MNIQQLSGCRCGRRYEKEYINKFRDCITFYFDENVLFQRYCYGEGACLVFQVWGKFCSDGTITYKQPFDSLVDPAALPKAVTDLQQNILYCDGQRFKWEQIAELSSDKANGYSGLRVALGKLRKK